MANVEHKVWSIKEYDGIKADNYTKINRRRRAVYARMRQHGIGLVIRGNMPGGNITSHHHFREYRHGC